MENLGADSSLNTDLIDAANARRDAELDQTYQMMLRGEAPAAGGAPAPGAPGRIEQPPDPTDEKSTASAVWTFMRELPGRSVLGGVRDAAQEGMTAFAEYLDWMTDKAADGEWAAMVASAYFPGAARVVSAKQQGASEGVGAPQLPEVPEPTTVGGEMARSVTQFVTAFAGPFKSLRAAGAGNVAAGMVAGAIADGTAFDPHEKRLANLVQEYPALQNPVTEYLQAKPGDSAAEGRLKNVVEGMGLGVATDGFVRSLRVLREARKARGVTAAPDVLHGTAPLDESAFRDLGDASAPLVEAVEVDDALRTKMAAAAKETAGTPPGSLLEADGGRGVFINWARIDTADDVKAVIQTAADLHRASIDEARRGVQSNEVTSELADAMGLTVDDLMRRRAGEPLNAETALAARKLWAASGSKVRELATKAADPNAGAADVYNFRRMMAVHHAIQKEVIAARTETARALQSWKIPAGSGEEQARALSAMMDASGGGALSREFAAKIAAADKAGTLTEQGLGLMAEKGAMARTREALTEAWINGLLSGPHTHLVNMMSNTAVIANSITERAVAARGAQVLGDADGVLAGEATQMMVGVLEGVKDLWRYTGKHFRMLESGAEEGATLIAPGLDLSKIDLPFREAITAENLGGLRTGVWRDPRNWPGNAVDAFGAAVRIPGKALQAEDAVFKTLGYRMELHAQAFRTASREGLGGAALKKRMAEIIANPPPDIRMAAVDNALYQTFTTQLGNSGQAFTRWVNNTPGLRLLVPFIRTPANILKYSFARTPLAPLMEGVRADIAAGGSRAQLAYARMALGTSAQLAMADLVYSGIVSGGGPPDEASYEALRRQGWQPYSVRVGDRWYSYQRIDPFNTILGTAADVAEFTQWAARESESTEDIERIWTAAAAAAGNTLTNKTYLQGLSGFFEAMGRRDGKYVERFLQRLAGSAVPTGVAQVTRAQDPYLLEVRNLGDAIKARTPGWSKDLPQVRDLWGRPIEYRSGLGWAYDVMSPIYSRREDPSAIDREMMRLSVNVDKPARKTAFAGVPVDLEKHPWWYDRYVELAGGELKHPVSGLGAQEHLNALVSGKLPESEMYNRMVDAPDGAGTKGSYIRAVLSDFRELARMKMLDDIPELADLVDRQRAKIIAQRQAALNQ